MNKSFENLTDIEKAYISAEIEKNISDEAIAREGYYRLKAILPLEEQDIINEIISDELDHSRILKKLVERYSKIYGNEEK